MRTREFLTQHPLYFLRTHSRASFCAVEMSAGVIFLATMSLFLVAFLSPDDAAMFNHIWAAAFPCSARGVHSRRAVAKSPFWAAVRPFLAISTLTHPHASKKHGKGQAECSNRFSHRIGFRIFYVRVETREDERFLTQYLL